MTHDGYNVIVLEGPVTSASLDGECGLSSNQENGVLPSSLSAASWSGLLDEPLVLPVVVVLWWRSHMPQ